MKTKAIQLGIALIALIGLGTGLASMNASASAAASAPTPTLAQASALASTSMPTSTSTSTPSSSTPTNIDTGTATNTSTTSPAYTLTDTPSLPTQTPVPTSTPLCSPDWSVVTSPNVGTVDVLAGVAALSASDVWAVGSFAQGGLYLPLVEHWNGSAWSIAPTPNPGAGQQTVLMGVSAVSATDVWAVGFYFSLSASAYQSLVEHWDGTTWSVLPSPNSGTSNNFLTGVARVSSTDVWAVGSYSYQNASAIRTLVEHWNGTTWSVVPSPNVGMYANYLYGVGAVSGTDVWAVGEHLSGGTDQTLVEHWNGSTWSVVPSPNVGTSNNDFTGVAGVSSADVWAVGYYYNGTTSQTLTEHWNGTAWSVVPSPNMGIYANQFNGVVAVGASDMWAVGSADTGTATQTLIEQWNGSTWSVVPSPNVDADGDGFNGVAALSASDVWAVGSYSYDAVHETLIEQYGLHPFQDVPLGSTFYPYVTCMACGGIVSGYPCGSPGEPCGPNNLPYFRPNNPITRGQFTKIAAVSAGIHTLVSGQTFQDVAPGSTFYTYTEQLAAMGVVSGYSCGNPEPCIPPLNRPYFRPNNKASRGQLAKMDSNAAGYIGAPSGQQFDDVTPGSTYYTYTYRLASRTIMSGYPCGGEGEPCLPPANLPYFRPNANATRGQTSKIVANTFFPDCQTPARR